MMIKMKDTVIGEGEVRVCVPIMPKHLNELLDTLKALKEERFDLLEWRADYYDDGEDYDVALNCIHEAFGHKPIIFTYRMADEGGYKDISNTQYMTLCYKAVASGYIDAIDLQGKRDVAPIIEKAKAKGVTVILSFHDFEKTPEKESLLQLMMGFEEKGADLVKVATLANSKQDALRLMDACMEASLKCAYIGIAMGDHGKLTRVCSDWFGSAITYAQACGATAPGQLSLREMHEIVNNLRTIII